MIAADSPPVPAAAVPRLPSPPRRRPWFQAPWLLWAVLLLAASFRFYGIHWDEGTLSHPDERHVLMSAHGLRWPADLGEYLDSARSPLNPRNRGTSYFAYGTLPTTLLTAAVEAFNVRTPEGQAVLGRALSACADLGVVLAVFALASVLHRDRRIALLAALLYSTAVLPIQHAHFFVVDPFGNLFATLALLALARATVRSGEKESPLPRSPILWSAAAGVALGLAAACKISLLVLLAPAGAALLLQAALGPAAKGRRARALLHASLGGIMLLAACALTFRLVEPDAFRGWFGFEPRWLDNMQYVTGVSRGIIDVPFTLQWVGRTRLVYPAVNLLLWGLGPAFGFAGVVACLWAGAGILRRREPSLLLPLLWVGATFFAFGLQWQMTMRYFLPLYAPLAVLTAWAVAKVSCWQSAREERRAPSILRYRLRWLLTGAVPVGTLLWAVAYLHIYTQPFTRTEASRWIYAHIPAGTVLGVEHWDDTLPLTLPGTPGQESYRTVELPWYEPEDERKRELVTARLDEAEYLVLASDKLYGSIPRTPWRYPMAGEYYRALFDGRLGFDLVADFRGHMNLLGWKLPTDSAEEAFSVYDHPRVLIFKKSPRYTAAATRALFATVDLSQAVFSNRPPTVATAAGKTAAARSVPTKTERDILLSDARWQQQGAAGSWRELFNRDSVVNHYPLLAWMSALLALGLVGFPYAFVVLRALPDRGAGLCRLFALALPSWALWFLASYERARFSAGNWWTALALLGVGGALIGYRRRAELHAFLRAEWPRLLAGEFVFWLAFALCATIRAYNPDVWHPAWGGEKPMELTYLHGVMKSDYFPPYNPWYAGGFINYYYFGFVLTGALIKAVGVLPSVGFNLCLATFFGFAAAAAFSVVRAMTEKAPRSGRETDATPDRSSGRNRLWPAFAGAAFVVLFGNLFQGKFLVERMVQLGRPDHTLTIPLVSDLIRAGHGIAHVRDGSAPLTVYPGDLYWCAARAIPVSSPDAVPPVTEFPFWSFLYADLHPHVIALPFTLALIGVLLAWLRGMRSNPAADDPAVGSPVRRAPHATPRLSLLLAMGFLLGLFWPTNTWDWPTYGALTGLTLFLACWSQLDSASPRAFFVALGKSLALFVPTLVLGRLAFRPFFQHIVSGYGAFELWRGERTPLAAYCLVHGFFLFVIASAFCVGLRDRGASGPVRALQCWVRLLREFLPGAGNPALRDALRTRFRQRPVAAIATLLGSCALYALTLVLLVRGSLPAALMLGAFLAGLLAVENRREPLRAFAFLLVALGFGLSLLVEFVVLAGDVGRMNTVFKFYYQVWVMFALASAALLPGILRALPTVSRPARRAWIGAFTALAALALVFPITGTRAKIADKFDPAQRPTLDGLAFLNSPAARCRVLERDIDLRADGEAIRWLQDNIAGTPVLLEMNTGDLLYSWGSRFSIHTGLPSVVGWDWHQRQQQVGITDGKVRERIDDVRTLYRTTDLDLTRTLLEKYRVSLVVIGELERLYGTPEGIEKFGALGCETLYDRDGVTILRVPADFRQLAPTDPTRALGNAAPVQTDSATTATPTPASTSPAAAVMVISITSLFFAIGRARPNAWRALLTPRATVEPQPLPPTQSKAWGRGAQRLVSVGVFALALLLAGATHFGWQRPLINDEALELLQAEGLPAHEFHFTVPDVAYREHAVDTIESLAPYLNHGLFRLCAPWLHARADFLVPIRVCYTLIFGIAGVLFYRTARKFWPGGETLPLLAAVCFAASSFALLTNQFLTRNGLSILWATAAFFFAARWLGSREHGTSSRLPHSVDWRPVVGLALALLFGCWTYTSFKLLAPAFYLALVATWLRFDRHPRALALLGVSSALLVTGLVVFITADGSLLSAYFLRGGYALRDPASYGKNLLLTLCSPLRFPEGGSFIVEDVHALISRSLLGPLLGPFFIFGWWRAIRGSQPLPFFAAICWTLGMVLCALAGPNLKYLLVFFPLTLSLALLGVADLAAWVFARRPQFFAARTARTALVGLGLLSYLGSEFWQIFNVLPNSERHAANALPPKIAAVALSAAKSRPPGSVFVHPGIGFDLLVWHLWPKADASGIRRFADATLLRENLRALPSSEPVLLLIDYPAVEIARGAAAAGESNWSLPATVRVVNLREETVD